MSVLGGLDGTGRSSVDHLFLDQDAVPTLVEVKRSSDTRIRREVVGQMLDYAANAVAYWPVEEVRAKFESRCELRGEDADQVLAAFLGDDQETDEFWQRVKTNLQAGRIRMVFIADSIPAELRRVVEFLNEQMDPAEVLAIEVKQFVGKGVKTIVPRVLGQTETARLKKRSTTGSRTQITESAFMEQVTVERTEAETKLVRRLIEWAKSQGLEDNFLTGKRGSAFVPTLKHLDRSYSLLFVQTNGNVRIPMNRLKGLPPFDDAAKLAEILSRIQKLPGLKITGRGGLEGFPQVPFASLLDESKFQDFTDTLGWLVGEIRATRASV